jgi:hypothetical protein
VSRVSYVSLVLDSELEGASPTTGLEPSPQLDGAICLPQQLQLDGRQHEKGERLLEGTLIWDKGQVGAVRSSLHEVG